MDFIWNMYQRGQISEAKRDASDAKLEATLYQKKTDELERRLNTIALACQAQWELLRENTNLQDNDILEKMKEIDLRDGRSDGKISRRPLPCKKCGRTINTANPKCMYCGAVTETQNIVT